MSTTSSILQLVKWSIIATHNLSINQAHSSRASKSKCTMTVAKKKRLRGYETTLKTRYLLMAWKNLSIQSSIIGATWWEPLGWTLVSPSSSCKIGQPRFKPFTKQGLQSVLMQPTLSPAKWGRTQEGQAWGVCKQRELSFSERRQRWTESQSCTKSWKLKRCRHRWHSIASYSMSQLSHSCIQKTA